eukprot:352088-Chlamydomonas_euryale.AAC.5
MRACTSNKHTFCCCHVQALSRARDAAAAPCEPLCGSLGTVAGKGTQLWCAIQVRTRCPLRRQITKAEWPPGTRHPSAASATAQDLAATGETGTIHAPRRHGCAVPPHMGRWPAQRHRTEAGPDCIRARLNSKGHGRR